MTRWVFVAVVVIGLLFLGGLHRFAPPAQADAEAPGAPRLSGKPVVVLAKDNVAATLEKVEVRQLGGRSFIVGRVMKDPPQQITKDLLPGATVWVPVDAVTQLIELEQPKPEK
jgi:hypothetical protein